MDVQKSVLLIRNNPILTIVLIAILTPSIWIITNWFYKKQINELEAQIETLKTYRETSKNTPASPSQVSPNQGVNITNINKADYGTPQAQLEQLKSGYDNLLSDNNQLKQDVKMRDEEIKNLKEDIYSANNQLHYRAKLLEKAKDWVNKDLKFEIEKEIKGELK